jgi:hypothetical protein
MMVPALQVTGRKMGLAAMMWFVSRKISKDEYGYLATMDP